MIGVAVALAGSVGALVRFGVDGAVTQRWSTRLPWATIGINVTGSLLLGILTGLVIHHGRQIAAGVDLRTILGTGFCGGYTTFSTASIATVRLLQQREHRAAVTNAVGSLVLTTLAAAVGLALTRV